MEVNDLEVEVHMIIRNKGTEHHAAAFGRGIAQLCELVEITGSLNKACKDMGMAYSKAWRIIRNTEKSLGCSLLERHGAHGSLLTAEAKKILRAYRETEQALQGYAQYSLAKALKE